MPPGTGYLWHSTSGTEVHLVLEVAAYFLGARIYWHAARALPQPPLIDRWLLLASAVFGAMLGSKLLHVLEHLPYLMQANDASLWIGGKSVLGGFIGGTLGVELVKKAVAWRNPTGDAWVSALAVGLMVGRMGCQFSGTWDQTYGIPTSLPWAWNYGDGIGRHPTGLYEFVLVGLSLTVSRRREVRATPGASFALFLTLYCLIRFALEWLKPPFGPSSAGTLPVALYFGFTAIQWAALAGLVGYGALLRHRLCAREK